MLNDTILQGTKAETLSQLFSLGYNVPRVYYFSVKDWNHDNNSISSIAIAGAIGIASCISNTITTASIIASIN